MLLVVEYITYSTIAVLKESTYIRDIADTYTSYIVSYSLKRVEHAVSWKTIITLLYQVGNHFYHLKQLHVSLYSPIMWTWLQQYTYVTYWQSPYLPRRPRNSMLLTLGEQVPQHLSSPSFHQLLKLLLSQLIYRLIYGAYLLLVLHLGFQTQKWTEIPFLCTPPWYMTVSPCRGGFSYLLHYGNIPWITNTFSARHIPSWNGRKSWITLLVYIN